MALEQRYYRTLIVSSNEKFIKEIGSLLRIESHHKEYAKSASEARRKLLECPYDFIIVNAPLTDEFGTRLCTDACGNSSTVAVIFAANDIYEEIYAKVSARGVFVIRKPTSGNVVSQALSLLTSARERLRGVEKRAGKAENKIAEIRVVNKAKWYLIDHENMSEADAHQYIEKAAMDSGITKMQAAQMIIEKYSLPSPQGKGKREGE